MTAGVETVVFVVGTVVVVRMHHHFWPAVDDDDDDDYNLPQIVAGTHDGWLLFQASLYRRKNAPPPMGLNC